MSALAKVPDDRYATAHRPTSRARSGGQGARRRARSGRRQVDARPPRGASGQASRFAQGGAPRRRQPYGWQSPQQASRRARKALSFRIYPGQQHCPAQRGTHRDGRGSRANHHATMTIPSTGKRRLWKDPCRCGVARRDRSDAVRDAEARSTASVSAHARRRSSYPTSNHDGRHHGRGSSHRRAACSGGRRGSSYPRSLSHAKAYPQGPRAETSCAPRPQGSRCSGPSAEELLDELRSSGAQSRILNRQGATRRQGFFCL